MIGEFLAGFEGAHDSDGYFTLDAGGQVEASDRFLIPLLQATVAAGASRVNLYTRLGPLRIQHDGRSIDPEGDDRAALYLARAIRLALGGPVSLVNVEADGWRSTFARARCWRTRLASRAGQSIEVLLTLQSAWRRVDLGRLADDVRYSGVDFTLNGRPLPKSVWGRPRHPAGMWDRWRHRSQLLADGTYRDHHLAEAYWFSDCNHLRAPAVSSSSHPPRVPSVWQGSGWIDCTAMLALAADGEELTRLEYVREGVVISREALPFGLPGLRVVLCVDDLRTDWSGLAMAKEHAWEGRLAAVRQEALCLQNNLLCTDCAQNVNFPDIYFVGQ